MASLNINIPISDTYYVRVRAYRQTVGAGGLVDLNVNGLYYFANVPVAGYGVSAYHTPQEVLNYFTCNKITGDPRIWMESSDGFPGKICAYNDDYGYNGGDWSWGLNSRIKKQIGKTISGVLLSTYGSYNPSTTCDLYIACKNSNIMSYFPLLKTDDAIQSAPTSGVYNCTSWAGGITSFWFWGYTPSYYYGNPQVWSTWDNYFGNNPLRYVGATTYTSSGANSDNGVVAMWALSNGEITHGSVRGYANAYPHGYDWESKPGSLMRTFHPRDALNGNSYGSIVKYYKNASGDIYAHIKRHNQVMSVTPLNKVYTFEQSIQEGLTTIEDVELTETEKNIISSRNKSNKINDLFNNWQKEITSDKFADISNPYKMIETSSGKILLEYSKNNLPDALLLFADVIFEKNENKVFEQNISYYMFCEIAKEKYGNIIDQIKKDWQNKCYNDEGTYIAPLPETFTKKYIKEIINQQYKLNIEKSNKNNVDIDNNELFSISPNPISEQSKININLPEKSNITVHIIDLAGKRIAIVDEKELEKGTYLFNINADILARGINLCMVDINGKTYIRKLLKK
ncbi:MAG: T9SS type A sorting domain-containing protein [Paludibacteraceae bacterium]